MRESLSKLTRSMCCDSSYVGGGGLACLVMSTNQTSVLFESREVRDELVDKNEPKLLRRFSKRLVSVDVLDIDTGVSRACKISKLLGRVVAVEERIAVE